MILAAVKSNCGHLEGPAASTGPVSTTGPDEAAWFRSRVEYQLVTSPSVSHKRKPKAARTVFRNLSNIIGDSGDISYTDPVLIHSDEKVKTSGYPDGSGKLDCKSNWIQRKLLE